MIAQTSEFQNSGRPLLNRNCHHRSERSGRATSGVPQTGHVAEISGITNSYFVQPSCVEVPSLSVGTQGQGVDGVGCPCTMLAISAAYALFTSQLDIAAGYKVQCRLTQFGINPKISAKQPTILTNGADSRAGIRGIDLIAALFTFLAKYPVACSATRSR